MYKVCGSTNYECTCGEEQILGCNLALDDATNLFLSYVHKTNSLDFTELDTMINELATEF